MNISIFDVLGPVMVGPSSSHTAGAVRIGNVAFMLSGGRIRSISFGLHGSFWQAGKGHGTQHALLAGAMGLHQDDERIVGAFRLADAAGLHYEFYPVKLKNVHENSVLMTVDCGNGRVCKVVASSVGGGRISIHSIDGFEIGVNGELPTVMIHYRDVAGVISEATGLVARAGVNIAAMKVSRSAKGMQACCIIETDTAVDEAIFADMLEKRKISDVTVLRPVCGGDAYV